MESPYFQKLLVSLVVLTITLTCSSSTSDARSISSTESESECSSNMTITQLKAVASNISCPENDERPFWEAACKCVTDNLPQSQCPVCRTSRETDETALTAVAGSDSSSASGTSRTTGVRNEQNMTDNPEARAKLKTNVHNLNANSSTMSNSANFIRFGK